VGYLSNGGRDRDEIWHIRSLLMMPELRIHAWHRESARYHTRRWKRIATCDVRCIVTALCNQPSAFTSIKYIERTRASFHLFMTVIITNTSRTCNDSSDCLFATSSHVNGSVQKSHITLW